MQKTSETSGHGKGVKFDLESVARRIMFRRLLSLRAPKVDKNEEAKAATIDDKNSINSNSNDNEQDIPEKSEIICSDNFDNKLVIEEMEKQGTEKPKTDEEDVLSTANDDKNVAVQDEENENQFNEESEEENEKKDGEKESAEEEADSSTESIDEDSNSDICKSESSSDTEGKDSGIEKGESPTLESKDSSDDEENSNEQENNSEKFVTGLSAEIPDLRTSSFVGTATLNVLSPVATKTKRLVKRSKQRSRKEFDLDSEVSCDCSSPEKPSRRKNMTISYLSYPQRFVRSSLAVEARLSQWRKETSVLENARAMCGDTSSRNSITRADTPTKGGITRGDTPSRNGILKQTQQRTNKHSALKAQAKDVRFPSNRHYDSDTSSDDERRMSVRKIYSSKSALRKRIENLEGMLLLMATQKCGLEELIVTMETWSLELSHVERTKLGVPYIRSVRDVLKKQRRAITNKTSNFNRLVSRLQDANVPCFKEVHGMIQRLNKEISSIVQDRKKYSSRHIEDIRQTQGSIIGTCSAITAVFYEE